MAKLISRDQPLVKGVYYPRGVYSRVVGLHVGVLAGVGVQSFAVSPVIAGKAWLLNVDIWEQGRLAADLVGGYIWLKTGTTKNPTLNDVIYEWEPVIDLSTTAKNAIYALGLPQHWSFKMNKLYSGGPRRFAVAVANQYDVLWDLFATFQISEG